jgi:hypothetical protein
MKENELYIQNPGLALRLSSPWNLKPHALCSMPYAYYPLTIDPDSSSLSF